MRSGTKARVRAGVRMGMAMPLALALSMALGGPAGAAGQWRPDSTRTRVLALDEAVRVAVTRNPQLRAARFALEESGEQVSEAWSNVFPTLDLNTTYTRNLSPAVNFLPAIIFDPEAGPDDLIAIRFGADNIWNLSLDAEQPLLDARAFIGVGAAGRFRALQEESVRGEVQAVVTRVRTGFYELLLAQEQLRLLTNSLRRVEESLAETRALNAAGLAADYDVLRLDVERANLEPNVRRAENAVTQGKRALGVELGLPDGEAERMELAGSLADMDLERPEANTPENRAILAMAGVAEDLPPDTLVALARVGRSDVRQLLATESLRQTELRLEQVEYLPSLSLFGSYIINSQQNGGPEFFGAPRTYTRLAGVRLTLPVFQGFRRDARIDQKRAALRQARVQTELAQSQAASEVRTLAEQVEEARLRADGQRLAVSQAERGFEIARAQYREGLGSQLELTDAEVALRESEFNYAQAVFDYLVARARLDEAVGRVPAVGEGA
ncbi:MAG: TolC family protein [Longimicrobiales bacterium]|nr:TolC family protein [Longimicrobiales bacterium]